MLSTVHKDYGHLIEFSAGENFNLRQILALIHELWNIKNTRAQKKRLQTTVFTLI